MSNKWQPVEPGTEVLEGDQVLCEVSKRWIKSACWGFVTCGIGRFRRRVSIAVLLLISAFSFQFSALSAQHGMASWYGEEHRGKLMANGHRFNPDLITAASWHYPLGTMVQVRAGNWTVTVEITDRGPHRRFVRSGRIIDLSAAAFRKLAGLELGLVAVWVSPLP